MQQHESAEETTAGNYNTQKSMCVEEEDTWKQKKPKTQIKFKIKTAKIECCFFEIFNSQNSTKI